MRRRLFWICLLAVISLLIPSGVVLGSYDYYIPITVTNNGSALSGVPVLVSLSNSQLASLGYIESSGLDTSTLEGTNPVSYLVTDDNLGLFIPSILGSQSRTYQYRLGDSVGQEDFPIIVGSGGYITLDDGDTPELGNNFEIEFEGGVDTSVSEDLIRKANAFGVYKGSGDISAEIIGPGTPTYVNLVPDSAGDYTNIASQYPASTSHYDKVDDTPASPDEDSTYVYTTSVAQQKDAYNIGYNSVLGSAWSIDSVVVYFRAKNGSNNGDAQSYLRLGGSETAGAVRSLSSSYSTFSETLSRPGGGSWTASDIQSLQVCVGLWIGASTSSCTQIYVRVNYTPPIAVKTVTASGVSSEGHIVNVWADGANFGIDIDGVIEDTDSVTSVPPNGSNWVISNLPYFNYYKQTVSSSLEVWYEPVTMVLGTALTDRSGNGAHGAITWGSNLGSIGVEIGGIGPYVSYAPPGTEEEGTPPEIIPIPGNVPTDQTTGATGMGLPLYISVKRAADSAGWSVPTMYTIIFIIIAIVLGIAGLVAAGSIWGFVAIFGATSALFGSVTDAGGYHVMPWFICVFCILFALFIGYIGRHT